MIKLKDILIEFVTPKPEEVIDAWREKAKANVKNWTGGSMHKYYCRRDNCGPAALDLKSFAKQEYGIELESPFPNKTQGFFRADKVISGKKDFTKEMKQEFLDGGGNFNNAKERNNILFIISLSVTGYKRQPLECGCPPESFHKYFSDGILQYCLKSLICRQFSYWYIPATIFQESPVPLKSNLKDEGQF